MNRKSYRIILIIIFISVAAAASGLARHKEKEITLEVGFMTGSNWDVANANSYVIIDKAIEKFEREHENVKVEYSSGILKEDYSEWLSQRMLLGNAPDVFMVLSNDFNQFASLGLIYNLDELMNDDKGFKREEFYSVALDAGEYNGIQYGLPFETMPTLMFVNKTLLQKEGISVPDSNWTWEELYSICERVTRDTDGDGSIDQFGTYNYGWMDAVYTNGASIFDSDEKVNLTNEKVMDAVKFVKQIYDLNQEQKVTQEDFDKGNVAFMPLPFSEYRTYKTYPYKIKKYSNFQWDCITLPAGENGGNCSEVRTMLLAINSNTEKEELAWEFLKQLTYDKEVQMDIFRYSHGVSVLRGVAQSKEAESILQEDIGEGEKIIDNQLLSQVVEQGRIASNLPRYSEVMALAASEIQDIIDKDKSIDSSLKILERKINQFLQQ